MLALVRDMEKYEEGVEDTKFDIVVKMIKDNLSNEKISSYVSIPIKEINEIRKEYFNFNE